MEINAQITISRANDDIFRIRVEDYDASVNFLEIEITPHDLAMALSGLSYINVKAEVRGLENIGKRRVHEERSVQCPMDGYNRKTLEQWIVDNCQEDGWLIRPSLGSQSSISYNAEGCLLRYSVVRWEEIK